MRSTSDRFGIDHQREEPDCFSWRTRARRSQKRSTRSLSIEFDDQRAGVSRYQGSGGERINRSVGCYPTDSPLVIRLSTGYTDVAAVPEYVPTLVKHQVKGAGWTAVGYYHDQ